MDINLPQGCFARVNEAVRCVRWDNDNAAGLRFLLFFSERDGGGPLEDEYDLHVGMRMKWRTLPRPGVNDVS